MTEKPQYASYNGLGREAMIGSTGIPLMLGLGIGCVFLLAWIILQAVIGPIAILVTLLAIPIFLFIRVTCGNDDKALRILLLELRCYLRRNNAVLFGNTLTLFPVKFGRQNERYSRFIKEVKCD